LLAGRSFSRDLNDDYNKIIVNEAFARKMGTDNPVGSLINWSGKSEIVGLVKDFHYGSLHNPLKPMFFRFQPYGRTLMIKLEEGKVQPTLERIAAYHEANLPGLNFDFTFLDEDYQALYESEMRVGSLSNYFAGVAIIISCLGLFGLASFTAERRTKEIGIRKILGATTYQLVSMLSADFTKMVLLSILIATPISYFLARNWLNGFAERIPLNGWYFVVAASATLLVAWFTVSTQTLRAARVDPVECLKDE
ncbi:MAG: FtsX-like permease family protein, partial [Bacteroidota bacterium]